LGVSDNERRYARDAYALCSILASREDVALIVAKRDAEGNPLPPSRLLFATDEQTIARRAKEYFSPLAPTVRPHPLVQPAQPAPRTGRRKKAAADPAQQSLWRFDVPRPQPLPEPLTAMNVTSFKEYLACPYRFYLKRVLKLEALDDSAGELDASGFGTLLHDVLEEFGQNEEARAWKDAEKVLGMLQAILDDLVRKRHGLHPLPAVSVQVEQIRYRLKNFAEWQAAWVAQGWRIKYTETNDFREPPYLEVDGQPMFLRARIDRIDYHAKKKEWYILDYKSGEAGDTPDKTHRPEGEWHDLQLPLYRELAKFLGVEGKIRLGYILLPKDVGRIGLAPADWTDADLRQALDTARNVVRKVRRQEFWPPAAEPPQFSDEFAGICLDRVIRNAECGKRKAE
jgi:RecB family exonuclease